MHQEDGSLSQSSCDSMNTSCNSLPNSPKFPIHNCHGSSVQQSNSSTIAVLPVGGAMSKGVSTQHTANNHIDAGTSPSKEHEYNGSGNHRRKRSRGGMQYYNLNGCLECEVKDAEIKTLRRRIQVMEEVAALLQQKMSALQQSSSNRGVLFSPMVMPPVVSQVVIPSTYATSHTTSMKVCMC